MCTIPSGREYQRNDPAVTVDYNTADPVVRWDSYENFNQRYQDSLDGTVQSSTEDQGDTFNNTFSPQLILC